MIAKILLDRGEGRRYDLSMTNNDKATAPLTHAERLARFSIATPTINFNNRPADRSRNGQRTPRSVSHRSFR